MNYNAAQTFIMGLLLASIPAILGKWFGHHLSTTAAKRLAYHDRIRDELRCQEDKERLQQHIDDLNVVGKCLIEKFCAGEELTKYDIEALERELAQRPKLRHEG